MAYLVQQKDINNEHIYPRTVSGAVYTSSTTTLNNDLERIDNTLDAKLDKVSTSANRVLVTDSNKNIVPLSITTEEVSCLRGVTSNIQSQLDTLDVTCDQLTTIVGELQPRLKIKTYRLGTSGSLLNVTIPDGGYVKIDNIFEHDIPSDSTVYSVQCTDIRNYEYPFDLVYMDFSQEGHPWGDVSKGDVFIHGFSSNKLLGLNMPANSLVITSIRIMVVYS